MTYPASAIGRWGWFFSPKPFCLDRYAELVDFEDEEQ